MNAVDHLVVVAPTLDAGVAWCRDTLGTEPGPGGRHALMGTHNRLFRIDGDAFPDAYFEIIAIDPDAPLPGRARWFGMDAPTAVPRLATFVARVPALDETLAALRDVGVDAGRALAASRDTPAGTLRWRIAVRDDGARPFDGALPTLIEWGAVHPAASMPPSGVVLRALTLRRLPAGVASTLGLASVRSDAGPGPALEAELDTPRGRVVLASA